MILDSSRHAGQGKRKREEPFLGMVSEMAIKRGSVRDELFAVNSIPSSRIGHPHDSEGMHKDY